MSVPLGFRAKWVLENLHQNLILTSSHLTPRAIVCFLLGLRPHIGELAYILVAAAQSCFRTRSLTPNTVHKQRIVNLTPPSQHHNKDRISSPHRQHYLISKLNHCRANSRHNPLLRKTSKCQSVLKIAKSSSRERGRK